MRAICLIVCVLGLSACVESVAPVDTGLYLERSEAIVMELKETLGAQLQAAMQSGGPLVALPVCQQVAQPLTKSVSAQYPNATVSRTALKVRNPENAADAESTAMMKGWVAELAAGKSLEVSVVEHANRVVVHQPILTEQVCLKCHGAPDTFAPELVNRLAELYPEDAATGFKLGELRGAFRVEFSNE